MTTESGETIMSKKDAAAREAIAPPTNSVGRATLVNTDCLGWMREREPNSIHAVVTDPPYGLREFNEVEKAKLRAGRGGVWRIPPEFDGCKRMPLPRFTTLTAKEQLAMKQFFAEWARQVLRVLVPGGHVFVAGNPLVSHLVYMPMMEAGFEKRGEIIRLVQTLRGGDRPKNAHEEFPDVTVMPRSAWEPWGLFRKPCEGLVQENLRKWKTGGLRRESKERPFTDVIQCSPTRSAEREIANHPSLKPQSYMRQVVRAALPLGEGIVLDPFMGGGSTLAAAEFNGYQSIGLELDPTYFDLATKAVPRLAKYAPRKPEGKSLDWNTRSPCASCPYRLDAPLGLWDAVEFEGLLASERDIIGKVYGCHGTRKLERLEVCVGWLLDQKRRGVPSTMLRLQLLREPEARRALDEISDDGLPLFESIEAMCLANGVNPRKR